MKTFPLLLALGLCFCCLWDANAEPDPIVLPPIVGSVNGPDKKQDADPGTKTPSPDEKKKEDNAMVNIVQSFEKVQMKEKETVKRHSLRPSLEARFEGWNLLSMKNQEGKKVCYMVIYPFNKIGNHDFSRRPYIMIVLDNYRRAYFVVAAGYYFYKNSPVSISVSGEHFEIEAKDYIAITKTILDDSKIIKKMLSGERIMIYARSSIGTYSVDVYSLKGFYQGYKRMLEICL